jgi:hypothetical protein
MYTTVIMRDEVDFGTGPAQRCVFADAKYTIDEAGDLHVYRTGSDGNIGAFPKGSWIAVTRSGDFLGLPEETRGKAKES